MEDKESARAVIKAICEEQHHLHRRAKKERVDREQRRCRDEAAILLRNELRQAFIHPAVPHEATEIIFQHVAGEHSLQGVEAIAWSYWELSRALNAVAAAGEKIEGE